MSLSGAGKRTVGKRESCGRNVLNPLLSEMRVGAQVCTYMHGAWSVLEAWRISDNTVRTFPPPSRAIPRATP